MRLIYVLLAATLALPACKKQEAPLDPVTPAAASAAPAAAAAAAPAAPATPPAAPEAIKGKILEKINASNYSYLRLQTAAGEVWAAVPVTQSDVGADVTVGGPMAMDGFESKTLKRKFDKLFFGTLVGEAGAAHGANPAEAPAAAGAAPAAAAADPAAPAAAAPAGGAIAATPPLPAAEIAAIKVDKAAGANGHTVAEIYATKDALKETHVLIQAKVVKYASGIMGRNWLHLRDGSGSEKAGDHDLTVTSTDSAAVGDTVTIDGVVRIDKDFGAGYAYKVMIEEAKIKH